MSKLGTCIAIVGGCLIIGIIAFHYVSTGQTCQQVATEYLENPELATETYGFDTYEEWLSDFQERFDYKTGC